MSIEPPPPPPPPSLPQATEDLPPPQPKRSLGLKLAIAAGIVVVLIIILGVTATSFIAQTPPTISGVTTAHGLTNGALVDETHVFGVGDEVHIVYTIRDSKSGYTLTARVTEAGKTVDIGNLDRSLNATDQGLESIVFTAKVAGVYQTALLLNNVPVPDTEVTFKVVIGGSPIQEVTTAKSIDQRTYRPLEQSDSFATRDSIHITYRTVNTRVGDQLAVVYSIEGRRQPADARDRDTFTEAGSFRGFFSISGVDTALAVGSYRVELFYNGDLVAAKMFRVTK